MLTARLRTWLPAVALVALAIPPRFVNLERLSFYGDEETSALPARSLADGNGPRMPTGIEYRRALPLTAMNAVSARLLGEERELSYRLPAAVLGTVTVPALYLVGRAFVGGPTALVAAGFLALSEWHLTFSRQSRMYAPFLLFFILAAGAAWRWAEQDARRRALWMAVAGLAAVPLFHALGLLAPLFVVLPLALVKEPKRLPWKSIAFALVAVLGGYLYTEYYVMAAYTLPTNPANPLAPLGGAAPARPPAIAEEAGWFSLWNIARTLAGAVLGTWLDVCSRPDDPHRGARVRHLGRFVACGAIGILLCLGHLYGASLATLVWLMILPGPRATLLRRIRIPAGLLAGVALLQIILAVGTRGSVEGIKSLVRFPFPYPVFLADMFPGVTLLFAATVVWLALRARQPEHDGVRVCVLATILPLAALGLVSAWGGTRYMLPVYPFLLLVAAFGLIGICRMVCRRLQIKPPWVPAGLAAVLVGSGLLGGHGIPQALHTVTLEHGEPVTTLVHMFPFRPDHKEPGEFVRRVRHPTDVVIAEDPIEQFWYAGKPIDYWLRSFQDSRMFVYQAEDGRLRDIYVNSELLIDPARIDSLAQRRTGRVWIITSGETVSDRGYYLDSLQHAWLDSLERTRQPAYVGRDGATKVYCLNCPNGTPD